MTWGPEIFGMGVYAILSVGLGAVIVVLVRIVTWAYKKFKWYPEAPAHLQREKYLPYECGVPLLGSSRDRFSVKFYLVALLFVLFDIETVFLLPYAVSYKTLGMDGFYAVLAFIAVLGVGLVYIIKRRALAWD